MSDRDFAFLNNRQVRLTRDCTYPAPWAVDAPSYKAGEVVPTIPARNQPDYEAKGLLFINTRALQDDMYGILIDSDDYEFI